MAVRATGRPAASPRLRQWRLAAVVGPVATGWFFGVGTLVSALGTPAWILAAVAIEATIGVGLAALFLIRSIAMAAWYASTVGCLLGWLAFVAVAGPWNWAGEITLILPAAILTATWPVARASEASAAGHG